MKKNIQGMMAVIAFVLIAATGYSQTKEKIDKAQAKGNVVFLAVTDGSKLLPEVKEMAARAQKKYPKSEVINLDRTDKTNAALVTKYGLSGAALPMILVMAPNGAVGGGLQLKESTPEKLIGFIPTKKQSIALLAFSEGKPAFILLSKKPMKDKALALAECYKSAAGLVGKAVVVDIDLDDKSEAEFLSLLKPEMTASSTHVLVFNGKGQFSDEFTAPVQAAKLITSSRKVAKSSCCPGGTGSGCGKK